LAFVALAGRFFAVGGVESGLDGVAQGVAQEFPSAVQGEGLAGVDGGAVGAVSAVVRRSAQKATACSIIRRSASVA